jgi:chemotaxis response regulator CheB
MVIGVGASAGGVDALQRLLGALPADFGAAIVVAMHRRGHSQLATVLGRATSLEVVAAEHGQRLRPGVAHVIPGSSHGLVRPHALDIVTARPEDLFQPSIDMMLSTLAAAYRDRAVGVVLTGALDDGVRGAHALYKVGAPMLAQSPEEAKISSMPLNIAMRDHPEAILPLQELAAKLDAMAPRKAAAARPAT